MQAGQGKKRRVDTDAYPCRIGARDRLAIAALAGPMVRDAKEATLYASD